MNRTIAFEDQIKTLERQLVKLEKINHVLMERVETSINSSGSAYTLFETNLVLQEKVAQRTEELRTINTELLTEIEHRKKIEKEKEILITKLRQALAEVKILSGLLPICSYCKNVRNDSGYWQEIETYIQEHSTAQFSHGICTDCMKKHFPDIYEKMNNKSGK
jgi:hypothetical protein